MRKQITSITTLTLSMVFGLASLIYATPVHAEEVVQGTVEMPDDSASTDNTNNTNGQDDGIMPISADDTEGSNGLSTDVSETDDTASADGDFQSEIILYDVEPETEASADEEAAEPPLWPLIVSASAMGVTLIVIIVLNLINRPKKS